MVPEDKVSAMIRHNKRHWHIVLVSSNIQPTPLRSGLNLSGLDPDEGIVIFFLPLRVHLIYRGCG